MNDPKNIEEYVAQYVIKHNKYRDEEINELKKALEDNDIFKCIECNVYRHDKMSCDLCDYGCCLKCYTSTKGYITHFKSLLISGTNMCKECSIKYCHRCTSELNPSENKYCEYCIN